MVDLESLNRPTKAVLAFGVTVAYVLLIAFLTVRGALLPAVAAMVAAGGLAFAWRYPHLALYAYTASIPLETVQIEGLATISRAAGAAFFVGYLLANRGIDPAAVKASAWLFVGWAILSVVWTIDQGATVASLFTLVQLLLVSLMIADAVSRRPDMVRPILWAYSGAASVTALLAVAAYATSRSTLISGRAGAFAEQDVAQFSAIVVPALIFLVAQVARGERRLLAGAGTVLCALAILLSGTRSAWLAVGIALLFAVLPRLRASQIAIVAAVIAAVGVATLQVPGLGDTVLGRVGSAAESGGAGRLDIWAVGLAIIADNPIFGVGYAAFPAAFTADAIRTAAVPGLDVAVLSAGRGSHSILLGTTGELGLIGLGLLAWLVVDSLRTGVRPWGPIVQGMVMAILFQALFLDILGRKQVWLVLALAFGLVYARQRLGRAAEAGPGEADPEPTTGPAGTPPTSLNGSDPLPGRARRTALG